MCLFLFLFEFRNVTPKCKWETVSSQMLLDQEFVFYYFVIIFSRLNQINAFVSAGERKQLFIEYKAKLEKQLRELHRERVYRARESMLDALCRWQRLDVSSSYKSFAVDHFRDAWFATLEEDERVDMFDDFMDKHVSKFRSQVEPQLRSFKLRPEDIVPPKTLEMSNLDTDALSIHQKLYLTLMMDRKLTPRTTFQEVCVWYRDSKCKEWDACSMIERVAIWTEVVYRRISDSLKADIKGPCLRGVEARDAFKSLLYRFHARDELKVRYRWKDVADLIFKKKSRLHILAEVMATRGSDGSHPVELWEDWKEEMEEEGVVAPKWADLENSEDERQKDNSRRAERGRRETHFGDDEDWKDSSDKLRSHRQYLVGESKSHETEEGRYTYKGRERSRSRSEGR